MKKIKEINIEKNHYIQIYTMYSIQYGTYNTQYINYCMYVYIYIYMQYTTKSANFFY